MERGGNMNWSQSERVRAGLPWPSQIPPRVASALRTCATFGAVTVNSAGQSAGQGLRAFERIFKTDAPRLKLDPPLFPPSALQSPVELDCRSC
ncbi:hypothetical protein AOLI_G00026000 [Acnodon oligacanthus]